MITLKCLLLRYIFRNYYINSSIRFRTSLLKKRMISSCMYEKSLQPMSCKLKLYTSSLHCGCLFKLSVFKTTVPTETEKWKECTVAILRTKRARGDDKTYNQRLTQPRLFYNNIKGTGKKNKIFLT